MKRIGEGVPRDVEAVKAYVRRLLKAEGREETSEAAAEEVRRRELEAQRRRLLKEG